MRKLFAALFCLLLPLSAAHAAASTAEARTYMDNVARQALSIISNSQFNKQDKQARLENLFSGSVDIPWVGRFVLGRYWRQATDAQRSGYLNEYRKFVTDNYAGRFAEYTGGSYKITNVTDDGDGEYTVTMEMSAPDKQQSVNVDYRLHTMPDGNLRIFDVVVEGVSLITTQRSEFASVMQNHNLDYLVQQMASKAITTPMPSGKNS